MMGMGMGVGFSSPPPWTPAALGADLWGVGTPASIINSDGVVATWSDVSGSARHETNADATKQPAYNATGNPAGGPCVAFDLTAPGDYLTTGVIALPQPCHILIACKWTNKGGFERLFDGAAGVNSGGMYSNSTSTGVAYAGAGINLTSAANGTWKIIDVVFNGASSKVGSNGGAQVTGNAGAGTPNGLVLGTGGHLLNPATVDMAAWMVVKRDLGADRAAAVAWLRSLTGV